MQPLPELDLTITSFSLNQSGTHAIAGGPTLADPELSAACLLDVAARRSHHLKGQSSSSSTKSADLPSIPLDEALFSSHPGLRILQIAWHPHSDRHVAILTSDATWRLYDVSRPDLAEQTFELQASTGRRGLGLDLDHVFSSPVAFSFGQGAGWDMFSVYFLSSNGSVSVLCPVAPFGARYPSHSIAALQEALQEVSEAGVDVVETAEAWLQRAFQPVSSFLPGGGGSGGGIGEEESNVPELHVCRPHALDDYSPALVGPLLVGTAEQGPVDDSSSGGGYNRRLLPGPVEALLMWRFSGACTAVAIASAKGPIAVHLLAGGAAPSWHPAPPQCVVEGLNIRAVRCQASSTYGETPNEFAPQLLLIDIIQLSPPHLNGQFDDDSDIDDGGVDNANTLNFGGRNGNSSSARTPGSRRVSLHLDLSSSDTFFSIYPGQAYSISLPWLSVLADYLTTITTITTTTTAAGALDGSRSGKNASPLPDALPSARAEELQDGPAGAPVGALAAVAVGDALCSSALLVLYNDGSTKCLRPRGAYVSSAGTSNTAAAGGGGGGGTIATTNSTTPSKDKIDQDTEAQIQRIYGEVLNHNIQNINIPRVGSAQLGTPTGTRALADAIAALRSCHVEFVHRAHHDLAERLEQLKSEVQAQEDRAERIAALVQQAETQRGKLKAGVERSRWMASNINRRLHLLAELHWALPRPASGAEVAFKKEELPAMEEAARRLGGEVMSVAGRVAALQRGMKPISSAAAAKVTANSGRSGASLPHSQLRQVRELLSEHDRAIRLAKQQAAALEDALMNATGGI
jgi:nuclear pore complex protein Nup88